MYDQVPFEIRWEHGGVELVGPQIKHMRFDTVGASYQHWKRCFAPLIVHAEPAGGMGRTLMRVWEDRNAPT